MPDKVTIVLDPGHGGENEGLKHEGHVEKYMNQTVAQSMKAVLEQYDNVEVYITNEDCATMLLKERAEYAKEVEADILISLHFNMSENHVNFGSEAWIPSKGTPSAKMRSLGDLFLEEFKTIGLHTRGVKTRLNDEGTDYYGIIRESEALGIPAILVEHCYADYKTDSPYIQSEEGLERFGQIDADAVAKYYGLTSASLGKDYSTYVKNGYFAPEIPVGSDKTGPENAKIYLLNQEDQTESEAENDKGQTLNFLLTAAEEESEITYYSYSLDGGQTYSEMFPWTGNKQAMIISVSDIVQGSRLTAKIYNGHTVGSETNVLAFGEPVIEHPPPLETEELTEETADDSSNVFGESIYQWFISDTFVLHMWTVSALLLAVSFILAASFWVRNKKEKIKKFLFIYGSICVVLLAAMFSVRGGFLSGPSAQMTLAENENKAAAAVGETDETEAEELEAEADSIFDFIDNTDKISLMDAQVLLEQKDTMEIVYDIAEGYLRVKSNPDIKRNSYDFDHIKEENGFKSYADSNGVKSKLGIDVSKFQGAIDFHAVKDSGVSFVIIRLGIRGYETGALVVDERFEENFTKAKEAGLDVGVYFFSGAMNVEEAREEAQFVANVLAGRTLEMPVVFDSELITYADARTNDLLPSQVTAHAAAFCEQTAQEGYQPMIYANAKRLTTVYHLEQLQNYPIWYADYQEKPIYPYAYDMWQYTEKGRVPGIAGNVDINLYFVKE